MTAASAARHLADRHAPGRVAAGGNRQRERVRLGRQRQAVHAAGHGQFRTEGPYDLTSPEWAAEFNEVKMLGSNDPSTRTEEQNRLASFVSFNLFSAYNRTMREIAVANGLTTPEQAMLFVRTTISAADALIGCWDNKEHWLQWRPQTAIRLADQDGNPDTVADPNWTAQFQNPGYPDNPSGFNCFTAGFFYAARQYFGTDQMSFRSRAREPRRCRNR